MKDKRDHMMNYPMYGGMPMPGMQMSGMPMHGMPGAMGCMPQGGMSASAHSYTTLANQINNLEKRVAKLESVAMTPNENTYTESNFYMV